MARSIQQIEINGEAIWFETEDLPIIAPALTRQGDDRFTDTSAQSPVDGIKKVDFAATLSTVLAPIQAACEQFKPDEWTVELAFGLSGKAGVVVASAETTAQIKVSATWKRSGTN